MVALITWLQVLGLLFRVGAEPLATHVRSCISGEVCQVLGIVGTGLANGDHILLADTCGEGPAISGMIHEASGAFLGQSKDATDSGVRFAWFTYVTPDGGEYRMCWCGVTSHCTTFSEYSIDIGVMTVTGPFSGLSATCTSGRTCYIAGIEGVYLHNEDSVMVQAECGEAAGVAGFPNMAKTTTGARSGTEHGWGQSKIAPMGGTYSLCWCVSTSACADGAQHRKGFGTLTVVGPHGDIQLVCQVYQTCSWTGVTGQGLQAGDRMMLLEECGDSEAIQGFPNSGIAVATGDGADYSFGSDHSVVTAGGAEYAMCWCGTGSGATCTSPVNFLVRAGTLTLQGPRSDHDYTCRRGNVCHFLDFKGVGLQDGDKLMILHVCGTGMAPSGFPNGARSVAADGGTAYADWATEVTAQFGAYRLCWCRFDWSCSGPSDYVMDAGSMRVVGVSAGQSKWCHTLDGCVIRDVDGDHLRDGDLMAIMTACGDSGVAVPGWPNAGLSLPSSASGTSFSWGVTSRVEAAPGSYKMCWCPYQDVSGCDDLADFSTDAGTMDLRGPVEASANDSCTAYPVPACLIGPFIGDGFTLGQDKVGLVSTDGSCGADAFDSLVAGGADRLVQSSGLVELQMNDLPFGGIWRICYCANYDSTVDGDSSACSSYQDFPALAGFLSVKGAYPGQGINCTRNQLCTVNVYGYGLDSRIHQIAVRDGTFSCGSDAQAIDTGTRRRRDFVGNPYAGDESIVDPAYVAFHVNPIQALGDFYICLCVPASAGLDCGTGGTYGTFDQEVGFLDVRGASAEQAFQCGRGGYCSFGVSGRLLRSTDMIKIVNVSTACEGLPHAEGFFESIVGTQSADTTSELAVFDLGRVTASGAFNVCYCASLGGCASLDAFNHVAGELTILDPLSDISFYSVTAATLTVDVNSNIDGPTSEIRCAITDYAPPTMPDSDAITNGLVGGLGTGKTEGPTSLGANLVEIFFTMFVQSLQQYRVWCVESSAQAFVIPDNPGGQLISTPDVIILPKVSVFPSYLWSGCTFYIELFDVYDAAVAEGSRRLSMNTSQAPFRRLAEEATEVRVATGSTTSCATAVWENANPMVVTDAGQSGAADVVLITQGTLYASEYRPYICFFAGQDGSGITMTDHRIEVHSEAPSFTLVRPNGQVTTLLFRGVETKIVLSAASPGNGLVHWTTSALYEAQGCDGASKAPPAAQVVEAQETTYLRFDSPPGTYVMCYLGTLSESSTVAPLNGIGNFDVVNALHSVSQDPALPSTRSTVRLTLEVRVAGTVSCLVNDQPTEVQPSDFSTVTALLGKASLSVPAAAPGTDAEYPRPFNLAVPLVYYQRTVGPLHVWCLHSAAEALVFPENVDGSIISLQEEEPAATAVPSFTWNGTYFKLILANTPEITTKLVSMHEPQLPDGWSKEYVRGDDGALHLKYRKGTEPAVDDHPSYTAWKEGTSLSDPCEDSTTMTSLPVTELGNTQSESWFVGDAAHPFVCYWAEQSAHPHMIMMLDIPAQPPEYVLDVEGQIKDQAFRGVGVMFRFRYTSPSEGRALVVRKVDYEEWGGACQDMGFSPYRRRLEGLEALPMRQATGTSASNMSLRAALLPRRRLQDTGCVYSSRSTTDLAVLDVDEMFPTIPWGTEGAPGTNCTRDFKLYYNPGLPDTSVLADVEGGMYMLLTSNESVLLHFVPRIHLMPPYYAVPEQDVSVVLNGFTAIGDVSNSSWVVDTRDCTARFLLDQGDPMYEEGSENLPLSQYYAAALPLSGFNFISVAYMPDASTMYQRQVVCAALQPPVPPPERPESVFDIDVPGLGRTVESGAVWVPSMVNGTGGFLHTGGLEEYVMCYVGDDDDASPIFNSIGAPFAVVDVLPIEYFLVPISPRSSSLQSYVNITSRLLGVVRCLALLSDAEPPLRPEDIFYPDTSAIYYLGSSDPVQFDQGGTSQVIAIYFDQIQAKFIAPSPSSRGQPEMRVWCAHEGSTIFYPYTSEGYALRVQARQPPSFFYKQLNATITSIALTLDLDLTDIVAEWENGIEFPANQYDAVEFSSKPLMPEGLEVNPTTGAIFGSPRPAEAGVFLMTIVATSINPPRESSETQLEIQVDDVLGLEWRSANVDSVVVTISPRSTAIYQVEEVFLLTQKGTKAFTGEPSEFFCTGALATQPFVNESKVFCSVQNEACCCAGFLLLHLVKQDIRILTRDCELEPRTKFHTAGVVVGFLTVTPGVPPARYGLRSSFVAEFSVPEEVPASEKYPVTFDLFIGGSSATDYNANPADYKGQLILELNAVVNIPKELVSIVDAREQDGGVIFDISFDVETRCLEQVGMEVRMLSFGIDVQEGCNLVAPKEYMAELDGQLRAEGSALFYRTDLELVKFADPDKSFSYALAMHFCTKEPFWKYGAVVESEDQCPLDMTKVGAMGFISITLVLSLLASIACYFSSEFASVSFLYQTKVLDVLTPLLALYTVGIDYLWLALLNAASVHVMLDALFMASMCHLFLCFCVNVVSMRIIITSYILDTPWWRRNKKRLRLVLFLSTVSPRFFRITRSHIFGFDSTHIHFGTPSKMSVVFANMSSLCVLQDVPQILLQAYVWVVWRNQGPQIAYICFFLHGLSILTAILHHVFSRSQRAAYERVVKLLGVRRLTAGFWDVTTAVAQPNEQGKQKADKKKMLTDDEAFDLGPQSLDDITDPSKLDPIQAAMYVSAMWDKEAKGANQVQGDDDELGSDVDEDPDVAEAAEAADKTLYPQALHDKLRKFYMLHDPAKVDTIGVGNVQVDEAEVDAMLKRFYNQGLDSVE